MAVLYRLSIESALTSRAAEAMIKKQLIERLALNHLWSLIVLSFSVMVGLMVSGMPLYAHQENPDGRKFIADVMIKAFN